MSTEKTVEPFVYVGTMFEQEIYMTQADYKAMKKKLCAGRVKAFNPKKTMSTEKTVEEIVEKVLSVYSPDDTIHDYEDKLRPAIAKAIQAERTKRDEMVEAERKRIADLLQDSIWPGELNKHTNNILESIKEKLTQPNNQN